MNQHFQQVVATLCLLVISPLLLVISAIIWIVDGSPVIFRQTRVGRGEREFTILKFRTMVNGADQQLGAGGKPKSRLTKTGKWLRKSSLDELPQLVNISRGEMAFVGPRACLPEVAANIPPALRGRFKVLPGVTGLAQVSGRNTVPWSKRLALDTEYAQKRSTWLDLKILARTVVVVLFGIGFVPDRNTEETDDLNLLGKGSEG